MCPINRVLSADVCQFTGFYRYIWVCTDNSGGVGGGLVGRGGGGVWWLVVVGVVDLLVDGY